MASLPYACSPTKNFMAALAKNPLLVSWLSLVYALILQLVQLKGQLRITFPHFNSPHSKPKITLIFNLFTLVAPDHRSAWLF